MYNMDVCIDLLASGGYMSGSVRGGVGLEAQSAERPAGGLDVFHLSRSGSFALLRADGTCATWGCDKRELMGVLQDGGVKRALSRSLATLAASKKIYCLKLLLAPKNFLLGSVSFSFCILALWWL